MCACLLGFSVGYDCIRADQLFAAQDTFAPYSMSRCTRDYGRASSWYKRDWAPHAKQHTKNSYSGWSKRATRGYHSDYDRSRQCEDSKPSDSTKDNEGATKVVTEAEVEVVESLDRNQGCAVTDTAVDHTQASTACDSTLALATEKDAVRSRLVELHRLLNNRKKSSLSATCEKNADANNRAYDMNQQQYWPWTPCRRSTEPSRTQ